MRWILLTLTLCACAARTTTRTPSELARDPRHCGDATHQAWQFGGVEDGSRPREATDSGDTALAVMALTEIAVTEPQAFRCDPAAPSQQSTKHYRDTRPDDPPLVRAPVQREAP